MKFQVLLMTYSFMLSHSASVNASRRLEVLHGHIGELQAGAGITLSAGSTQENHPSSPEHSSELKRFYVHTSPIESNESETIHLTAGASLKVQKESKPTHKKDKMHSPVTVHILDTSRGLPAADMNVQFYRQMPSGDWVLLHEGKTNSDGRMVDILEKEYFYVGIHKMKFETKTYFAAHGKPSFYPYVEIIFEVTDPNSHHHIPLILSPYGYTTYRGS